MIAAGGEKRKTLEKWAFRGVCPQDFRGVCPQDFPPWLDVYGFAWVVTHPYRAPAYRIGFRKEYAIAGPLSIEPHLYFDLGPERWNHRRFGEAAGDAHYHAGFNAVNFHLLFKWALADWLSLYAGVRQFDALTHEVRRQTRARARRDETDFTYFVAGVEWRF